MEATALEVRMTTTRRLAWLVPAACVVGLGLALSVSAAPSGPATAPATKSPAPAAKPTSATVSAPTSVPASSPARRGGTRRDQFAKARRIEAINDKLAEAFKAGQFDKCEPLIKQILDIDPNSPVGWYNYACYQSRVGQLDKAVESLAKAISFGYSGYSYMQRDPDLDAIRKLPGYQKLRALQDEFQRQRADKVRDALAKQFGQDYVYEIDHDRKLVFATNIDSQTLAEMKDRLTAYATAQWKDLFDSRFDTYLTIVIPKTRDWRWGATIGGFYSQESNMLIARTVGLTLIHEFTHALHRADQQGRGQRHPIWLTEGLATLFESSRMVAGHAVPEPNARLNALQRIIRRNRQIPLADLMKSSPAKFMEDPGASYSQVRYLMMYLHSRGLLGKWYQTYCDGYESDETGQVAMEKVLGKKLGEIEKDWHKWVLDQKPTLTRLPPDSAYIGIQLCQATDGVEIISIVPRGGADKAGLKAGDVILEIDGERVFEPSDLMNVVHEHDVGDAVKVRYRRGGKYAELAVTLTKMPGARPMPSTRPSRPAETAPAGQPATSGPASRPASAPANKPPTRRTLPPPTRIDKSKAA
jgi:tetratricopeptide (TPR) repeat protein